MNENQHIEITTRDRLLRAQQNSMEMVRDFVNYSNEIEDDEDVARVFSDFAKQEGMQASKLRELLEQYQ